MINSFVSSRLLGVLGISLALSLLFLWGCGLNDDSGVVTLDGRVVDSNNDPVPQAMVRATLDGDEIDATQTDEEGRYRLNFEVRETSDAIVTVSKDGVSNTRTVTVFASAEPIEVQTITLSLGGEVSEGSGSPSNILLLSQSSQSIGVKESGSTEVAQLTFQVADSTGRPVTLNNQTPVRFYFGQHPDGGEFIAPEEAETNNDGQVTAHVSSGTAAGAVQVIAEIETENGTIRSKPVGLTIHGGLPDQDHFTLALERFNVAGLNRAGETNTVSVIVGDKYSNPVKPGTAVYFSASHGVIEGDATTDNQGRGSVTFMTANPRPSQDGIVVVEAETADENDERVFDLIPMVVSGRIVMEIDPTEAILDQTYTLTLTDELGNPLAEGTSLSVSADGTGVQATGHVDVTLGDTEFDRNGPGGGLTYDDVVRGSGITEFTFRTSSDGSADPGEEELESITISVSGPNGNLEVVLTDSGDVTATSTDGDVEAVVEADGNVATIRTVD